MSDELVVKTVDAALATSVQPRARAEGTYGGMALLSFLAQGAGLIAPWWSKRRDADLARFWPNSAHLAGAFYTLQSKLTAVPFRIEPRDASIKQHRAMAEVYQRMLEEESEFGLMLKGHRPFLTVEGETTLACMRLPMAVYFRSDPRTQAPGPATRSMTSAMTRS